VSTVKSWGRAWILVAAAAVLLVPSLGAAIGNPVEATVRLTPIGAPTWRPADFHLFSVDLGADVFAGFADTQKKLLPHPRHEYNSQIGIVPGVPHVLPLYNRELAQGVAANGFKDSIVFTASQFELPKAVFLAWMTVPGRGAKIGSSPDYPSQAFPFKGPVIANALFKISVTGVARRNGVVWDPALAGFEVPAVSDIPGFSSKDGHSHFPFFVAEAFDFIGTASPQGVYQYDITMTDSGGAGWSIRLWFLVL
jgi:hypothetical protein